VVRIVRRLSAIVMSLGLLSGNAAVCAGWAATPEARMACCSAGGGCPMHEGDEHGIGSDHAVTQAQADDCCISSERENSTRSSPTFVAAITSAVLGTATVLPARVPAFMLSDGWRTSTPVPVAPVPRHVLLSVFLV
jgi:hypothetical protein